MNYFRGFRKTKKKRIEKADVSWKRRNVKELVVRAENEIRIGENKKKIREERE